MISRSEPRLVEWLESFINFERGPGSAPYGRREYQLGPFRDFLGRLGNPQDARPAVHIAGTKGKGSVAALVDALARAAGLTTGRFTSPHICSYCERISLQGEPVGCEVFDEVFGDLKSDCERFDYGGDREFRSLFELMTAGAAQLFRERCVDVAVWEVGLGGRLDATNTISSPLVSVITSIGYDHTNLLGDSVEDIAREKAGIIKRGRPVVLRRQDHAESEAIGRIIEEVAREQGSYLTWASDRWSVESEGGVNGCVQISRKGNVLGEFGFSLGGLHQRGNLEAALATVDVAGIGPASDEGWIELLGRAGLDQLQVAGRMEVLQASPPVVIDGAHCPLSVAAALGTLREIFPDTGSWNVGLGVLRTKDVDRILGVLTESNLVGGVWAIEVPDVRGLESSLLAEYLNRVMPGRCTGYAGGESRVGDWLRARLAENLDGKGMLVIGSLFNIGPAQDAWKTIQA